MSSLRLLWSRLWRALSWTGGNNAPRVRTLLSGGGVEIVQHRHIHKRRIVTRAASWQQKGDATRKIADEQKPRIKRALKAAIIHFRQTMDLDAFKQELRTGSQLGARRAFPRLRYEDALRKAFEAIAIAYEEAGKAGAAQVHNLTLHARRRRIHKDTPGFGGQYAFDRFTPEVQRALRFLQDNFIKGLSAEAADAVEEALYDGMVEGWSVDKIAKVIRDVIGLNGRQAQAVDNYRAGLEARGGISAEEVDSLVGSYVDASLDYRAGMIAQTESVRSANLGLHEGYRQAIERGTFPHGAVRRHWQIARDEATCPVCLAIPGANEDGVAVEQPFDTNDGPIMDPPVHPNCRCSVTYVTDLDMVEPETTEALA
jgi:hypothetical protein